MQTTQELRDLLKDQLDQLDKQLAEEKKAKRNAVKRQWRFTIQPSHSYQPLRDPSISCYELIGEVLNKKELLDSGHPEDDTKSGAMKYLFNTKSNRIITSDGGGAIFISDGRWSDNKTKREES